MARAVANHHDVWVLTRANNRAAIEAELARDPVPNLHFVYFDLPRWTRWWKRGQRGVHLYYYLWQVGAFYVARRIHRKIKIDLVHHVTFVSYWKPSLLAMFPYHSCGGRWAVEIRRQGRSGRTSGFADASTKQLGRVLAG